MHVDLRTCSHIIDKHFLLWLLLTSNDLEAAPYWEGPCTLCRHLTGHVWSMWTLHSLGIVFRPLLTSNDLQTITKPWSIWFVLSSAQSSCQIGTSSPFGLSTHTHTSSTWLLRFLLPSGLNGRQTVSKLKQLLYMVAHHHWVVVSPREIANPRKIVPKELVETPLPVT